MSAYQKRPRWHHHWHHALYSGARMKSSFVRLVATLLLSGQTLPVGLPLFCDQVQRGTSANCEQQMASHRSGPVVDVTAQAAPCANPAFCAITASAVLSLNARISSLLGSLTSSLSVFPRSFRPTHKHRSLLRPKPSLSQA